MKDARLHPPILPTVKEIIHANADWEQGIYQGTIQPKGNLGRKLKIKKECIKYANLPIVRFWYNFWGVGT